jgi:hypothetical protein
VALPFRPELRHEYAFVTAAVPGLTRLAREFLAETRLWLRGLDGPPVRQARSTARSPRTRKR